MAKKDTFTLDEFGFDSGLDIPDMDFDMKPPKDDRKPITKATQGLLKGAKDTTFSNNFVKKFIKTALPKGYGDAMEMVGDATGTARKLYNTTAKEIKPTINEAKKTLKRAMPNVDKRIPKGLADKLKKWADSAEESQKGSEDYRESGISAQLGEIFHEQAKQTAQAAAETQVKSAINETIQQARHKDVFGQLDSIRLSTARLAAYQDKVTIGYHRKSLELQFRQYYMAADLLEEQKKSNAQFQTNLAEIVKNTGLPEYAKLQNSERLGDMMRNKFMGKIYDSVFDKRNGYLGKAVNRLGTRVKDKITDFAGDVQSGLGAANMAMDGADMARDMGASIDPYEMAGGMAGGMIADSAGKRLGKKAGALLNKSRFGRKIRTVGNDLEYGVKNISQIGDKFSRGDYDYSDGPGGKIIAAFSKIPGGEMLLDALKDAASTGRPDYGFKQDGIKDMQGPAIFSNQARKSITEVIPGFLARIYQELQIIRTGDSNIGLTEYDYSGNKFASSKEIFSKAMASIVSKDQTDRFNKDHTELLSQVDPEGKLSKKERAELGKFFLSDNFKNGLGDPKRFTDPSEFRGVSAATAKKAASLFGQNFGVDDWGGIADKEAFSAKRNKFASSYANLGSNFDDSRGQIQDILNVGQHDVIRQSGLMDEKGNFNPEQLHKYLAGESYAKKGAKGKKARVNGFSSVPSAADHAENNGFDQEAFKDYQTKHLDLQQQILDAIKSADSKQFEQMTADTTARIEKLLLEGQIGVKASSGGGIGGTGSGDKRKWYQMSIGDLMGSIASGVGSGIAYAGDQLSAAGKGLAKLGSSALAKGMSIGKKSADWLLKKRDEYCDLYIKGEAIPRIQAWRMKAGHYIDEKTGEVIRKFSDIKGNVIDRDGNLILSLEDMKNIVPPDVRSYAKKGIDSLISFGKSAISTATGFYGTVFKTGKMALTQAKGVVMKLLAKDVYVAGEDQPRLLAITMRVGGYRSKLTGKTIWRPLQIDGPVMNSDGEVVLSDADLRKGINDSEGKPFKSIVSRIFTAGKDIVSSTMKNLKGAAKWTAGKATDAIDIVTQFVKNGIGVESGGGLGLGRSKANKIVVDRLTEIRDLLKDRLPERKRKVLGDTDGDGDRENSWQDMDQKRDAAAKALKDGSKSGLGVGKLLGGSGKEKEKKEDEDGMDLSDAKAGWDLAKDGWKGAKKLGGKALGWGAKLLGMGEAASVVAGATGIGAAATGAAATTAAGTAAVAGGAAAGGGALAAIGGGLATVGAGVLGFLSSPVVIGAGLLAGAYFGYKYLTKKKLEPLSTYRFAQYGFTNKDTDALQKVFGLEDRLEASVDYSKGSATIKDDIKVEELLRMFDINPSDKKMVYRWTEWFQNRFKPVYLTHMTVLHGIAPSVSLRDVDSKLKPEEKKKYFDGSRFSNGPYSNLYSPVSDKDALTVTGMYVEEAGKICLAAITKELGDAGKKSETGVEEGKTPAVAAAAATALGATAAASGDTANQANNTGLDNKAKSQDSILTNTRNSVGGLVGASESGLGYIQNAEVINTEKQITPLNAVRYRSYGLYNLEIPKINNLLTLEQAVLEEMTFASDGVSWGGNIDRLINKVGGVFGVSSYSTKQGEIFSMWFNSRFLPIFSAYVRTIFQLTGKKNIRDAAKVLTPSETLSVANAVYAAKTTFNGQSGIPIWSVSVSPWADYVINTNEATVHESIRALTEKANAEVANEKVPVQKADALTQPTLNSDKANQQAQQNTSIWDKTKSALGSAGSWVADKASGAWNAMKSGASAVGNTLSSVGSGISNAVSNAAGAARDIASNAGNAIGTAVGNVAAGIGGMMDSIPMPTIGGSYAALKDTIGAASKMVGVDEKLMAIMAAIESGFNYSVKAGTSSAKGLYQFIDSTWKYMVKNYGSKYGIDPNTPATDPRANAIMGAEFLKMNLGKLAPVLGRAPTYTDAYLAHFMGDGGAKKFLSAMKQDPGTIAASIFPKEAGANPSIFYKDKERTQPRTLQEVYGMFTNMINQKAKTFKIDTGLGANQVAANDPKATSAPAGAAPQGTGVAPGVDPKADAGKGAVAGATAPAVAVGPAGSKTAEMIAADSKKAPVAQAPGNGPAVPGSASPMQTGFGNVPPSGIAVQSQTSKDDFNKSIGTIDSTLLKSLEVQRDQLRVLQGILDAVGSGALKMPNASNETAGGPIRTGPPEESKKAPVPMRKSA